MKKKYQNIIIISTLLLSIISIEKSVALALFTKKTPFKGSAIFTPSTDKSYPGIVLLHGSEGGSIPYVHTHAQILALEGFSVLTLCWFSCNKNPLTGPPSPLYKINLNTIVKSIQWFQNSKFVKNKNFGIYGISRGAELALLLSELTSSIKNFKPKAIAVHVPSDVIVQGFSWSWIDKRCWVCKKKEKQCQKKPYSPTLFKWNSSCGEKPSLNFYTANYPAWTYNKQVLKTGRLIRVDKYKGPLFISHGTQDEYWKEIRSKKIKTLRDKYKLETELHIFKGESHVFKSKNEHKKKKLLNSFFKKHLLN